MSRPVHEGCAAQHWHVLSKMLRNSFFAPGSSFPNWSQNPWVSQHFVGRSPFDSIDSIGSLSNHLSVYPSICSVYLNNLFLSICVWVYISNYLSVYQVVYQEIYLPIQLIRFFIPLYNPSPWTRQIPTWGKAGGKEIPFANSLGRWSYDHVGKGEPWNISIYSCVHIVMYIYINIHINTYIRVCIYIIISIIWNIYAATESYYYIA